MKVLFIVTAYPRHEGDVITPWLGETIDRLRKAGIEVEVLAPSYKGSPGSVIGGVRVHRFRYAPARLETLTHDMPALDRIARNPFFAGLLPSYLAAGTAAAARLARKGSFDVVHVFWPIPHGLFGLAAKRASGAAMVSTFFSAELNWKGATRKVVGPILKAVVRGSDAITVISSFTGKRLGEYVSGVDATIVPFGAAAADRGIVAPVAVASGRATRDPFELLFVGRLVRRKGVSVLLRAASLLEHDKRLRITIVGGGPEEPALRSESSRLGLEDVVSFEGVVPAARMHELFVRCDALVLPAIVTETGDTEGLGVVLIEAMGYGKPVIASSAGGIVDIVQDGETGLLVPPGDAEALAAALTRAMDDPDGLERVARRGSAHAERAFGWEAIVSHLSAVYASAVAAHRLRRR